MGKRFEAEFTDPNIAAVIHQYDNTNNVEIIKNSKLSRKRTIRTRNPKPKRNETASLDNKSFHADGKKFTLSSNIQLCYRKNDYSLDGVKIRASVTTENEFVKGHELKLNFTPVIEKEILKLDFSERVYFLKEQTMIKQKEIDLFVWLYKVAAGTTKSHDIIDNVDMTEVKLANKIYAGISEVHLKFHGEKYLCATVNSTERIKGFRAYIPSGPQNAENMLKVMAQVLLPAYLK